MSGSPVLCYPLFAIVKNSSRSDSELTSNCFFLSLPSPLTTYIPPTTPPSSLQASERLHRLNQQQRIILMSGGALNCVGHYGQPAHTGYPPWIIGMLPKSHLDCETVHHACRVHCLKVAPSLPHLPSRLALQNTMQDNDNNKDNSNDRGSRSTVLRSSSFKDRIRVDKFHQGAVLHRGLFSKVVQGQSFSDRGVKDRNGKLHVMVAIKILRKDRLMEENHVDAAKRELDFMRRLSHPHIIECLGWDMDSRRIYLFMEYAVAGSSYQYIYVK